jgi:hypothetical protein
VRNPWLSDPSGAGEYSIYKKFEDQDTSPVVINEEIDTSTYSEIEKHIVLTNVEAAAPGSAGSADAIKALKQDLDFNFNKHKVGAMPVPLCSITGVTTTPIVT